jgi:competence protein ComFC
LSCHKLSWQTFCNKCQDKFLKPSISKRKIGSLDIYSFFKYQNIEDLLLTKHTTQGYIVYRALAKQTFRPFIKKFIEEDSATVYIIGIDENIKSGYSHVSLLSQQLECKNSKVLYSKLMATNQVNYSGKNLQFRLENPRNFHYSGVEDIEAILVDDIITTGTTLKEAVKILEKHRVKVLFALTLADAKA